MTTKTIPTAVVGVLLALALTGPAGASTESDVDVARSATANYHDVAAAIDAGYGRFTDAQGIACIDNPGVGGMGVHYVNGDLVGDDAVDERTPEALVYAPSSDGTLHLVAAEYIVFRDAWGAHHSSVPRLFGQEFELVAAPNRYGIPAFYELHAWLWRHNSRGMFDDWNPKVSCDA